MRNTSFFEKLTGSLRLSDDDLNALSEQEDKNVSKTTHQKISNKKDEIVEEIVDDEDFEIPDDAEVETIEEIIEDDSIDEEEVEEYYEEIIDEDEEEDVELEDAVVEGHSIDFPVFHLGKDTENEDTGEDDITEEDNNEEIDEESSPVKQIELPVDVFEMHNEVVLRILVPGITPENLKVSITRDHVSLTCTRPTPDGIKDSSYFEREIPYGDFTRMIQLPSDVDVEHAEAVEKYGLLIIRLPKLDSKKVQELKIRSV